MARVVVPGIPHHLTQRGNRRATVFDDDASRTRYLQLLGECAQRFGVEVWAYCLMTNHVHWIVVPKDEKSLARCSLGAPTLDLRWR